MQQAVRSGDCRYRLPIYTSFDNLREWNVDISHREKEKAAPGLNTRDRKKTRKKKMQEPVAESQGVGFNSLEYHKEILVLCTNFCVLLAWAMKTLWCYISQMEG